MLTPYLADPDVTIHHGDALEVLRGLPDESVHCCITSPPYWGLRDYGTEGQLGLEATPDLYVARMVEVFAEVRRVLRADGTFWLNIGDSYAGSWSGNSMRPEGGDQRPGGPGLGLVARKHGRRCIGIELSEPYCELASRRLAQQSLLAQAVGE